MTHNEKIVTLKLRRIDVCDLLLACSLISAESDAQKWDKLHEKLKQILDDFDEANFKEEEEKPSRKTRPLTPQERCRNAVYATGNRWAIENFNATH